MLSLKTADHLEIIFFSERVLWSSNCFLILSKFAITVAICWLSRSHLLVDINSLDSKNFLTEDKHLNYRNDAELHWGPILQILKKMFLNFSRQDDNILSVTGRLMDPTKSTKVTRDLRWCAWMLVNFLYCFTHPPMKTSWSSFRFNWL